MNKALMLAAMLAGGALCASASAQGPSPEMIAEIQRVQAIYAAMPDTPGTGPYPAVMEADPALPGYVLYRPAQLDWLEQGELGLFIWGNGGCADDGASARLHLAEIASHGYLVIAPGQWRSGPNAQAAPEAPRGPAADGRLPAPATTSAQLTTALDWALAENLREGSAFRGLIDGGAVAVGGYSCGGMQALQVAADPRWQTVVIQNSGLFNGGTSAITGMVADKALLQTIHTPVLYLNGGEADIAYANGMDDFARIGHVPAAMVNLPVGHGGTYHHANGGKGASIVVDWLEWQLRGNRSAARSFAGENCRLCTDEAATIALKNWP